MPVQVVTAPLRFLNDKPMKQYLTSLIYNYSYSSYQDLSEEEQSELTALANEADAKSHCDSECITDARYSSDLMVMFRKLLAGSQKEALEFTDFLKTHVVRYYADRLEDLFQEVYHDYHNDSWQWSKNNTDPDESFEQYQADL